MSARPTMSLNLSSSARKSRRAKMAVERGLPSELCVILPEPNLRKGSLVIPYPSEIFPTDYNNRLPEWRRRASDSATQEHWKNWKEYQLAALGTAIGLSNLMQFPFQAASSGRGSFVIAYAIIQFLIGYPILFLQMALGQFTSKGAFKLFRLVPLARGAGYSLAVLSMILIVQTVVAHSTLIFFVFSAFNINFSPFSWDVPWKNCKWTQKDIDNLIRCLDYRPAVFNNSPAIYCPGIYYQNIVLMMKVDEPCDHKAQQFHWRMGCCLFLVLAITYAFVSSGIKAVGKIMLCVIPMTLCCLVIFLSIEIIGNLIKGNSSQGLLDGISYILTPEWEILLTVEFWFQVTQHVTMSLSLDTGTMTVIGAYARFQSATHYHAFYVCLADFCVSLISCIIMNSYVGIVSQTIDVSIEDLSFVKGLGQQDHFFITILGLIDNMNAFSPLWVFIFFTSLVLLQAMNVMAMSLIVLKPFYETFPRIRKWKYITDMVFFLLIFLVALPFVTIGGRSRLSLIELLQCSPVMYVSPLLVLVCVASFVYCYGLKRLRQDMDFMLAFYPNRFFAVMWVSIPILILLVTVAEMTTHYETEYFGYKSISWLVLLSVLLPIPIMAIWNVVQYHRRGELAMVLYPEPGIPQKQEEHEFHADPKDRIKVERGITRHVAHSALTDPAFEGDVSIAATSSQAAIVTPSSSDINSNSGNWAPNEPKPAKLDWYSV